MQGFVGGIGHHESKSLYEKCAILHVLGEVIQRSVKRRVLFAGCRSNIDNNNEYK